MVLETLWQVLESDYRGPRAVFTRVHVLKALIAIGSSGTVGRGRLGTLTGLGQGEVRTLIKRLKDNQLITIETGGCRLSRKGEKEYSAISSVLVWSAAVEVRDLALGEKGWAVVAASSEKRVRYGIEQRDAAVRAGADGAFTAVFRAKRFTVPGEGTDCEKGGPSEPWITIRKSNLHDGDIVLVTGSSNLVDAENGALAAFLTLL
jgi:hypothetical protein